jgi:hypothetical protein
MDSQEIGCSARRCALLVAVVDRNKLRYSQRLVARFPTVESKLAVGAGSHIVRLFSRCILPTCVDQLLGFAFPSLLSIVWPSASKCCLSSFLHIWLVRGLLRIVSHVGFNRGDNCPAAFGSMRQMFDKGVVVSLPAVKALVTQETLSIVGVLWCWVEEKSSASKLQDC